MRKNTVKEKLKAGKPTVGGWLTLGSSLAAEALAHSALDWLVIDLEHSPVDMMNVLHMLQAISTTSTIPFVRVPDHGPATAKRVLDLGAYGIVFPHVSAPEQAQQCVAACKYPPEGIRGYGPLRAAMYGGSEYLQRANEEIMVVIMIEDQQALDNLESIMSVAGIDVAVVGQADLAVSLGLPPSSNVQDAEHVGAVQRIVDAGKKLGVPTGTICETGIDVRRCIQQGMTWVSLAPDIGLMLTGLAESLAVIADKEAEDLVGCQ